MIWRRLRYRGAVIGPVACVLFIGPASAQTAGDDGTALSRALDAMSSEEIAALSLTLALVAFAVIAAILYVRTRNELTSVRENAKAERSELAARADRTESLLRADRQVIIAWTGDGKPEGHVVRHVVPGAPDTLDDILNFAGWMAPDSAALLDGALERLRESGTAFDLTLMTNGANYVEADGRAVGGRAVLRIRDATSHRRELAELREHHVHATRDAEALRTVLDEAGLVSWLRDESGNLVWASEAFARLSGGLSSGEAVSERFEFAPADTLTQMARARDERAIFRSEITLAAPDAERKMSVTEVNQRSGSAGIALEPSAGGPAGSLQDYTWRADVLNRIDIAIAIFKDSGRLAFCNHAYRRIWQLDDSIVAAAPDFDELLERWRADDRVPALPDGVTYREWADGLVDTNGGKVLTHEWDLPSSAMSLRLVTIPHDDGSCAHIVHDLTESLGLQTKMRAQTRVQRQTLESLSEAIAVFGQNGKLKLFNPRFASMWDLDAKALTANPHIDDIILTCSDLCRNADDWRFLKQSVCGFLDAREPIQRPIERKDGSTIALSTVPLADGATLAVFTDITAAKSVERALRERNEALEQAAELRGNFVSNVSYHLRDPLQTIIGFAQLLSDSSMSADPAQQSEYASYILSSSSSLMAMVNDILDLASIDADVLELEIGTVDVAAEIAAAAEALQDRIEENGITLDVEIAPQAAALEGDARRIRQILFSLMANAVAHSPQQSTVNIDARVDGDMIAISVTDTGDGIPENYLDRVFDSFESRTDGGRNRGPGLGLSLARGFAEKHGGSVEIESTPASGTTVTCRIPRERPQGTTGDAHPGQQGESEKVAPHA